MPPVPNLSDKFRAELLGTFVFVLVGAGSAVGAESLAGANSGSVQLVAALANGLGLAIAVTARAYGPMIAGLSFPGYWYIYTVGPIVGAVLAALAYHYFIESPGE